MSVREGCYQRHEPRRAEQLRPPVPGANNRLARRGRPSRHLSRRNAQPTNRCGLRRRLRTRSNSCSWGAHQWLRRCRFQAPTVQTPAASSSAKNLVLMKMRFRVGPHVRGSSPPRTSALNQLVAVGLRDTPPPLNDVRDSAVWLLSKTANRSAFADEGPRGSRQHFILENLNLVDLSGRAGGRRTNALERTGSTPPSFSSRVTASRRR